ncbi:MAG: hypothetical protein RIR18_1682 [Pseudomonadota bacterium]|jgi:dTDP-4-dehydrorhamnose 3,5-epimerase-like enzyme
MEHVKPHMMFEDSRGRIRGVLNHGHWGEVNYIESFAGTVRGNHYHRATTEAIFLIEGKVEVTITQKDQAPWVSILGAGDTVIIPPGETHVFRCLDDTKWINLLSEKFDPQQPDIHTP